MLHLPSSTVSERSKMELQIKAILFSCLAVCILLPSTVFAASNSVKTALSMRDGVPGTAELIKIAGGEDQLVNELLSLRHDESLPFVSIRAEKLLLQFSDREEVANALEADLNNPNMQGLARIIAVHIDSVPNQVSRERLARSVISRAKRQSSFMPYAKTLASSKTSSVSRLARQELE